MAHGSTTTAARRRRAADAARPERRGRRPLRALRPLPRLLPDLLRARHRDGLAARPHLPDQVARRGAHRADRLDGRAPRPLPRLPRVRDRVSVRRAVRPAHRGRARRDRAPAAGRPRCGGSSAGSTSRCCSRIRALLRWPRRGCASTRSSGLQRLVRATRPAAAPARRRSRHWEPLLPTLPRGGRPRAAARAARPPTAPRRARVGLLTGCIQQVAFGPQNRATARVLARNGVEVLAPRAQACCGALHAHAGEHDDRASTSPSAPSRPSRRRGSSR